MKPRKGKWGLQGEALTKGTGARARRRSYNSNTNTNDKIRLTHPLPACAAKCVMDALLQELRYVEEKRKVRGGSAGRTRGREGRRKD